MVRPQAQFDERAGVRRDLGLPSVICLITLHGLFRTVIPDTGRLAIKVLLADQSLLDLGGTGSINFLLPMLFPGAFPGAPPML